MKRKLLTCLSILSISSLIYAQNFTKTIINTNTLVEPYTIASGHLDGDAYLDIAVGSDTGSDVTWYKNNTNGTFTDMGALTATAPNDLSYVEGLTIADINGDGDNDIIATSYVNANVVWFENNGSGFDPAVEISGAIPGAGQVSVVNIDNDANGYLDIIVSSYDGNKVVYFLGNGDGTFGVLRDLTPTIAGSQPGSFDLADYDGDGDLDAVVAFTGNGNVIVYDNRLIPDGIDGSGNVPFTPYTNDVDTGNGFLWTVSFADINDDSSLDIIKSDNSPGTGNPNIAWYSKDMSGIGTTFTETNITTSITRTAMASVADFNNDTYNDLLVTNGRTTDNDFIWFTSDTSGGFGSEIIIDDTSSSAFDIEIQDFDNDGDLDIASISYLLDDVFVFFNDHITLGVEENTLNEITMYPNPTKNNLHFKGNISGDLNVSIYNVLGKRVINETVEFGQALNVSKLNNGVYIIKFNDYNTTYKFVKQ